MERLSVPQCKIGPATCAHR
uniref:Uncharacterized protein n=1 Tax=Anguilla anguilla TaxID=7936 RepID=A0A0E9VXS5_ANGAN